MGILDSMFEKHAAVVAQRENTLNEAENFISQTNSYFGKNSAQFIDMQWIETVREQCATHIKNVNDASAGVVFSRTKIVSVRKQLEDLSKGIEDNVQRHNEKWLSQ